MDALIISLKDKVEMKLILELLKKMQIESQLLTEEQLIELDLIRLMKRSDRNQKVSRAEIMQKLGRP